MAGKKREAVVIVQEQIAMFHGKIQKLRDRVKYAETALAEAKGKLVVAEKQREELKAALGGTADVSVEPKP